MSPRSGGNSNGGNGYGNNGSASGVQYALPGSDDKVIKSRKVVNKKKACKTKRTGKLGRVCPVCGHEFDKRKSLFDRRLGKSVLSCPFPNCGTPLHINTKTGEVFVLYDKLCVDRVIETINRHKSEREGFSWDLGEATPRERKFAYEFIKWVERFMNGVEVDLGMDTYEFLERFIKWVLGLPWWKDRFESLLMLKNSRGNLAAAFYYDFFDEHNSIPEEEEDFDLVMDRISRMAAELTMEDNVATTYKEAAFNHRNQL